MKPIENLGREEILEHNEQYMLKRLTMHAAHMCSIQYHNAKPRLSMCCRCFEDLYREIADALEAVVLHPDQSLTIKPLVVHRMEAVEECIYLESSTPELDDTVRLQDIYGVYSSMNQARGRGMMHIK